MIRVFAIEEYGKGFVTQLGDFETLEEVRILPHIFKEGVVIEFEEYKTHEDSTRT